MDQLRKSLQLHVPFRIKNEIFEFFQFGVEIRLTEDHERVESIFVLFFPNKRFSVVSEEVFLRNLKPEDDNLNYILELEKKLVKCCYGYYKADQFRKCFLFIKDFSFKISESRKLAFCLRFVPRRRIKCLRFTFMNDFHEFKLNMIVEKNTGSSPLHLIQTEHLECLSGSLDDEGEWKCCKEFFSDQIVKYRTIEVSKCIWCDIFPSFEFNRFGSESYFKTVTKLKTSGSIDSVRFQIPSIFPNLQKLLYIIKDPHIPRKSEIYSRENFPNEQILKTLKVLSLTVYLVPITRHELSSLLSSFPNLVNFRFRCFIDELFSKNDWKQILIHQTIRNLKYFDFSIVNKNYLPLVQPSTDSYINERLEVLAVERERKSEDLCRIPFQINEIQILSKIYPNVKKLRSGCIRNSTNLECILKSFPNLEELNTSFEYIEEEERKKMMEMISKFDSIQDFTCKFRIEPYRFKTRLSLKSFHKIKNLRRFRIRIIGNFSVPYETIVEQSYESIVNDVKELMSTNQSIEKYEIVIPDLLNILDKSSIYDNMTAMREKQREIMKKFVMFVKEKVMTEKVSICSRIREVTIGLISGNGEETHVFVWNISFGIVREVKI